MVATGSKTGITSHLKTALDSQFGRHNPCDGFSSLESRTG